MTVSATYTLPYDTRDLLVKDIVLYKRPEDRRLMIDSFRKAGLPG